MINCCICGKELPEFMSNNPEDAAWKKADGTIETPEFKPEDRCCDECNQKYVIPGRLYRIRLNEQKQKESKTEAE